MNTKFRQYVSNRSAGDFHLVIILFLCIFAAQTARAEIVELSITGSWSANDFKVTETSDPAFDSANPKFDGKVFGVAPSAGNVTVRLRVNTEGGIFFPKGYTSAPNSGGTYSLAHDFYGYSDVTLVSVSYKFGTANWENSGILTGLEGPDGTKAALWTDVDITKGDPTRVSFRMFGRGDGITSDLFFGSRTNERIGGQFLLWEYYNGGEIRSPKYSATTKAVPVSAVIN